MIDGRVLVLPQVRQLLLAYVNHLDFGSRVLSVASSDPICSKARMGKFLGWKVEYRVNARSLDD